MTDLSTQPPAAAIEQPNYNLSFNLPARGDEKDGPTVSIDLAAIPANARLDLLRSAAEQRVKNRVNVAEQRNNKERAPHIAWAAYNAAQATDPSGLHGVAKPEGEPPTGDVPAPIDRVAIAQQAIADLLAGKTQADRPKSSGKRNRTPVDPLIKAITGVVVNKVFKANQEAGTTIPVEGKAPRAYTYPDAVKAVGSDGLAYLNAQIEARVNAAPAAEQAALRTGLEGRRDAEYVNPARILTGQTALTGKSAALPALF